MYEVDIKSRAPAMAPESRLEGKGGDPVGSESIEKSSEKSIKKIDEGASLIDVDDTHRSFGVQPRAPIEDENTQAKAFDTVDEFPVLHKQSSGPLAVEKPSIPDEETIDMSAIDASKTNFHQPLMRDVPLLCQENRSMPNITVPPCTPTASLNNFPMQPPTYPQVVHNPMTGVPLMPQMSVMSTQSSMMPHFSPMTSPSMPYMGMWPAIQQSLYPAQYGHMATSQNINFVHANTQPNESYLPTNGSGSVKSDSMIAHPGQNITPLCEPLAPMNINPQRKEKEPPIFTGDVSVDYYLEKFDEIGDWNEWTALDRAQQLRFSLSESMEKALYSIPESKKYDYEAVKKALRQYRPAGNKVTEEDFWKRIKKHNESLHEYAAEIRDLAKKVFRGEGIADYTKEQCEANLLQRFKTGLHDADMERWVHLSKCSSLQEALDAAVEYDSFGKVEKKSQGECKDVCMPMCSRVTSGAESDSGMFQQLMQSAAEARAKINAIETCQVEHSKDIRSLKEEHKSLNGRLDRIQSSVHSEHRDQHKSKPYSNVCNVRSRKQKRDPWRKDHLEYMNQSENGNYPVNETRNNVHCSWSDGDENQNWYNGNYQYTGGGPSELKINAQLQDENLSHWSDNGSPLAQNLNF